MPVSPFCSLVSISRMAASTRSCVGGVRSMCPVTPIRGIAATSTGPVGSAPGRLCAERHGEALGEVADARFAPVRNRELVQLRQLYADPVGLGLPGQVDGLV